MIVFYLGGKRQRTKILKVSFSTPELSFVYYEEFFGYSGKVGGAAEHRICGCLDLKRDSYFSKPI
ncbi:hypothetical protein DLM75_16095 [Leptospira stimsonii]|uniref:Uncharacterized protein n=1 Tax=Leptospira stimsonii TaxID=2202203 RepID=A0A396Z6N0_9LEPT|nr:hypothetical protein DLM75_16095 [Leptospira stimsonii]